MRAREEDKIQDGWYEEAKKQTPETINEWLAQFIDGSYTYDYGAVCHAIAAAAVGAAWAVAREQGMSGFQAGAVMWQFIQEWNALGTKGPLRLLQMERLLYPQYAHKWQTIDADTWEWLQAQARERIAEDEGLPAARPAVRRHWRAIVEGVVPFGLAVEKQPKGDNDEEV